ncbi:MAG: hypothetical protein KJ065_02050 [Anaerolineae bacterium]|nr:hypothetical protein [Anaerolineae bacterium]
MSDESTAFAARIRERYPEGLTGVFAVGGTRTTFVLEQTRNSNTPGRIQDFSAHGEYLITRYWQLIRNYFDLGGQNAIVTMFSFRGFYNRGAEYSELVTQEMLRLIDGGSIEFYRQNEIDPYFVGIDTLLHLPPDSLPYRVGRQLADFQASWPYQPGRCKVLWEMASIPLFSFWKAYRALSDEESAAFDAELAAQDNLEEVNRALYRRFSKTAFGTEVPMPHFYLGTNKSGDLKWRSPMPLALTSGDYMRMFYTPYPTLFITRETLQTILTDLAFKDRFYSDKTDYDGKYTRELIEAEYERVMQLSADPQTTLGLSRRVAQGQNGKA